MIHSSSNFRAYHEEGTSYTGGQTKCQVIINGKKRKKKVFSINAQFFECHHERVAQLVVQL